MHLRLPRLRLPWSRASRVKAEVSCAVVAQRDVSQDYLNDRFPGWTVLHPCDPIPAWMMFDEVLVLLMGGIPATDAERQAETEWLLVLQHHHIKAGGEFQVMAPR